MSIVAIDIQFTVTQTKHT